MTPAKTVLIRGGTVIDTLGERSGDVLISGAVIKEVGDRLEAPLGAAVLDASGCIVAPGLVDLHTHLRQPGAEESETVESGSRSAALGGFTAVVAMPNTDPPIDSAPVAAEVLRLGLGALCQIAVAGAITIGRKGECLAPIAELAALGVRIFTDDGSGVQDASVMRNAFAYAKGLGVTLAQHCEDSALSCGGHMHEGVWSSHLGVQGIPAAAEEVMVARDLILAKATGARVHFLHLSTAGSVELVRRAKADGVEVTAEVTPHHLSLTDGELAGYDPIFKVNPPLRSMTDVEAVRAGCFDGTIDAIATDHAPHPQEAKELPLDQAPPGLLGLQTALAVSAEALVAAGAPSGTLDIRDVIGLLSWKPALIAGLAADQGGDQGGPILPGNPANLFVFDPAAGWNVESSRLASRSKNSPWVGRKLLGAVRHTVFRGEPVVIDSEATR